MKKKYLSLLIVTIFMILLFINNKKIQLSVIKSCTLFLNKLVPSLFPMMIICDLLIYLGMPELLWRIFGKLFKNFLHISSYGSFCFFISLLSGTPTNAYLVKSLVNEGKLSNEEASYILSFSFFTNPLFYYTMLQFIFPNNNLLIIKLFLAPYLTNLIIAFLTRPKKIYYTSFLRTQEKNDFLTTLIMSIKRSVNTLLMILGTICTFFIINSIINPYNIPFISGILEVSQGLNSLALSNLSIPIKSYFTLAFISFGGLSIILQIKSILLDSNISLKPFFKARFWQILISIIWLFI